MTKSNFICEFLEKHPLVQMDSLIHSPLADGNKEDAIWSCHNNVPEPLRLPDEFIHMLLYVRNINKNAFNAIEGKEGCIQKTWTADATHPERPLMGGGAMTVIRETTLEKSAVNMSIVSGPKYPAMESEHAGKPFTAAGVSLISHPRNPNAPIIHMNVRIIRVFHENKTVTWIGGGSDLTPMVAFEEDTLFFHNQMRQVCLRNPANADYEKYMNWAKEYFYIIHRKEERGIGGLFFDFIPLNHLEELNLLVDVGQYNARTYAQILAKRIDMPYDDNLAQKHLIWRGRYAEFNLAYDRGTRFGLLTGGNAEAILCSLSPRVCW